MAVLGINALEVQSEPDTVPTINFYMNRPTKFLRLLGFAAFPLFPYSITFLLPTVMKASHAEIHIPVEQWEKECKQYVENNSSTLQSESPENKPDGRGLKWVMNEADCVWPGKDSFIFKDRMLSMSEKPKMVSLLWLEQTSSRDENWKNGFSFPSRDTNKVYWRFTRRWGKYKVMVTDPALIAETGQLVRSMKAEGNGKQDHGWMEAAEEWLKKEQKTSSFGTNCHTFANHLLQANGYKPMLSNYDTHTWDFRRR